MATVRALPRRTNAVQFRNLPVGHAFRFYGQIFMKTADEWAFSLTMRAEVSFQNRVAGENFYPHSNVIPIGRVEGFDVE